MTDYRKVQWADKAACKGRTELFFDEVWPDIDSPWPLPKALERARAICDSCPVRRPCFEEVMRTEMGVKASLRYGIFAGLTPDQRRSLEARGRITCPHCDKVYDPALLREGRGRCDGCGHDFELPELNDRGDRWAPRHSRIYRIVLAHFHTVGIVHGDHVPAATRLAADLSLRENDMHRVYQAFIEDGVVIRVEGVWVKATPTAARLARSVSTLYTQGTD